MVFSRPYNLHMNATVTTENKSTYLLVESAGELKDTAELLAHCKIVFGEIEKNGLKKVLINEPGLQFPTGLFRYYELVMHYVNNFPPEFRHLKIAVIISNKYKEIAAFWETVCVNNGFDFFAFDNVEDALNWLLKSER